MSRERKKPVISKPAVDEEIVLRFAEASEPVIMERKARGPEEKRHAKGKESLSGVDVTVNLPPELHHQIFQEAARKNRSVAEFLERYLTKQFGKR